MALSPEDVRNKLFTTVRLREGYEQAEVDEFLDEVETELSRLLQENDDLRTRLAELDAASADRSAAGAAPAAAEPATHDPAAREPGREPARPQQIVVRTTDEVGAAAAKVLNMAQRTADEVVSEARDDAGKLLDDARSTADRLTTDARLKADQVDRDTRDRTSSLEQQLEQQRHSTLGRLQAEKNRLEQEVESLRSFEREYRGRLRMFLEGQLHQLSDRSAGDTPLAPSDGPDGSSRTPDGPGVAGGSHAADDSGATAGTAPRSDGSGSGEGSTGDAAATGGGSRSALGRILEEEEERNSDDRR